jgi:hypothetical protein
MKKENGISMMKPQNLGKNNQKNLQKKLPK